MSGRNVDRPTTLELARVAFEAGIRCGLEEAESRVGGEPANPLANLVDGELDNFVATVGYTSTGRTSVVASWLIEMIADDFSPEAQNSAAPDLLAALRAILDDEATDTKMVAEYGGYVLDDDLREAARAAIAKAVGE